MPFCLRCTPVWFSSEVPCVSTSSFAPQCLFVSLLAGILFLLPAKMRQGVRGRTRALLIFRWLGAPAWGRWVLFTFARVTARTAGGPVPAPGTVASPFSALTGLCALPGLALQATFQLDWRHRQCNLHNCNGRPMAQNCRPTGSRQRSANLSCGLPASSLWRALNTLLHFNFPGWPCAAKECHRPCRSALAYQLPG